MLANMVLQLVGLGLLAWAAIAPQTAPQSRLERQLSFLILAALSLVLIQLVPLPPSVWPHLGGRQMFASGYALLGIPIPWLPISLAPYDSIATVLTVIPPLALLATMLRLGASSIALIGALLSGMIAGVLLGVLQVSSNGPVTSPFYLYSETNVGSATGFFANADHMGTLLIVSIPFLASVVSLARNRGTGLQRYSGVLLVVTAAAAVVAIGIALNGSLAAYGLITPVSLASILLIIPAGSPARRWVALASAMLLVAAIAILMLLPIGARGLRADARASLDPRQQILTTSLQATKAFMPLGSGLGTFERVYQLYEDHNRIDPTTLVNHAHNDYAELALEAGLPSVFLICLFVVWWLQAVIAAWKAGQSETLARAAAIASAAILIHSIVDFPLRTAAISSCFALCIGLLVGLRPVALLAERPEIRPTRHVVIS